MKHFITGASSGIGAAVAAALYARGDELTLLARTKARAQELSDAFPGASLVVGDLAQPVAFESMLALAMLPLALDSLLHIAGVAKLEPIRNVSAAAAREQLDVNLLSPMLLTRALLPALRKRRGLVVLANSSTGIDAKPDWAAYCASKFGLRAFADSLRAEEQANGIRVTSLYLGRTATPMQQRVHAQEGWDYDPSRWIQPDTVAASLLHLLDLPQDANFEGLWIRPQAAPADASESAPGGGARPRASREPERRGHPSPARRDPVTRP